mmetsp:Transcript_145155/g.263717  ORF Transcript_145155/g.263717 Transcript_145155/m.263717 type:complete len:90 (-) Transcript_145155:997-1266(-)
MVPNQLITRPHKRTPVSARPPESCILALMVLRAPLLTIRLTARPVEVHDHASRSFLTCKTTGTCTDFPNWEARMAHLFVYLNVGILCPS